MRTGIGAIVIVLGALAASLRSRSTARSAPIPRTDNGGNQICHDRDQPSFRPCRRLDGGIADLDGDLYDRLSMTMLSGYPPHVLLISRGDFYDPS
jgi:hypothetical protein